MHANIYLGAAENRSLIVYFYKPFLKMHKYNRLSIGIFIGAGVGIGIRT
jgi:hypothetical protein